MRLLRFFLPSVGFVFFMVGCGAAPAASRHATSPSTCAADDDTFVGTPVPVTSAVEISSSERARQCKPMHDDVVARLR